MGSVRWAFRCGSWTPSRSEWLLAARCVQPEEKERIGQFVFTKDAKSAMAGRLLLRKLVCERMGIPWSEIRLERSPRGKPLLVAPDKVSSDLNRSWSFNLSHQGDYAVLAAEQGVQVGVDVMKITMPGSSSVPEFFRIMTRQFTAYEWSIIQSAGSEYQQLAAFYRHWTLKESFIKAIGTGLGFNLQRVEFHLPSEELTQGQVLRGTKMHLDEEQEEQWMFEVCHVTIGLHEISSSVAVVPAGQLYSEGPNWKHTLWMEKLHECVQESLLDADHHVAVALRPADRGTWPVSLPPPATFTLLSFSELIASASPLTEEDPSYWDQFRMKAEAPQRQRDAQIST